MNEYGVYRVTGKRRYRGHERGTTFEARLDRNAERRAIDRGDIVFVRRVIPSLEPGSYRLPLGWGEDTTTEAPEGVSFMGGGR